MRRNRYVKAGSWGDPFFPPEEKSDGLYPAFGAKAIPGDEVRNGFRSDFYVSDSQAGREREQGLGGGKRSETVRLEYDRGKTADRWTAGSTKKATDDFSSAKIAAGRLVYSKNRRSNHMAHMLAKLRGVKAEDIKKVLHADASGHAEQGFYLEHLWQNADDSEEVLFLFRVDDLSHAKRFIEEAHMQSRKIDPRGNLPHMTFLEEK